VSATASTGRVANRGAPARGTSDAGPTGADPAVRTVLSRLTALDRGAFARDVWGHAPLLTRAAELPAAEPVLTLDDVDTIVSRRGLRTPFVRLTKDGVVVPSSRYAGAGGIGASIGDQVSDARVLDLVLDGATIVLQALHRTWEPVMALCSQLSAELACPVQANAYITPPSSQGFDDHYDVHDVFVLQLAGTKHWRVHEPVHAWPLPDQAWTQHREALEQRSTEDPLLDVVLRPGDCLYLPRGTVHAARTTESVSAHLTIGVHPVTVHAVARELLTLAAADPAMRAALPLGAGPGSPELADAVVTVLAVLQGALAEVPLQAAVDALADAVLPQTRPSPLAPLAQAEVVRALTDATPVVVRPGLQWHLSERAGALRLRLPEQALELPSTEEPALRALLAGPPLRASDLGAMGAQIDALGLISRLLRAGVLVPAGR